MREYRASDVQVLIVSVSFLTILSFVFVEMGVTQQVIVLFVVHLFYSLLFLNVVQLAQYHVQEKIVLRLHVVFLLLAINSQDRRLTFFLVLDLLLCNE